MSKITLTESQLHDLIKESIENILKEAWEDDYNQAMDKLDYQNNKNEYDSKKWYQKILAMVSGNKPKDPNPDKTLEQLLNGYVDAFNREHNIGKRDEYGNGETFHSKMNYNTDTKMPVLKGTYSDGNTAYQSRRAFKNDGSHEEWGVSYPYSEFGVTMKDIPSDAHDGAKRKYQQFNKNTKEISDVINRRNNKNR